MPEAAEEHYNMAGSSFSVSIAIYIVLFIIPCCLCQNLCEDATPSDQTMALLECSANNISITLKTGHSAPQLSGLTVLCTDLVTNIAEVVISKATIDQFLMFRNDASLNITTSHSIEASMVRCEISGCYSDTNSLIAFPIKSDNCYVDDPTPTEVMTPDDLETMTTDDPKIMTSDDPEIMTPDDPDIMTTDDPETMTTDDPETMTTDDPEIITDDTEIFDPTDYPTDNFEQYFIILLGFPIVASLIIVMCVMSCILTKRMNVRRENEINFEKWVKKNNNSTSVNINKIIRCSESSATLYSGLHRHVDRASLPPADSCEITHGATIPNVNVDRKTTDTLDDTTTHDGIDLNNIKVFDITTSGYCDEFGNDISFEEVFGVKRIKDKESSDIAISNEPILLEGGISGAHLLFKSGYVIN